MKNKKFLILFLYFITLGLSLDSFIMANPVVIPGDGFPARPTFWESFYEGLPVFFIGFLFAIIIESIFGYILFFRKNKKGISAVTIANLISFPLFYLYLTSTLYKSQFLPLSSMLPPFIFGESAVIFFEMFIFKIVLRKEITYKKAFTASLSLNLTSLLLGFVAVIVINIIQSRL